MSACYPSSSDIKVLSEMLMTVYKVMYMYYDSYDENETRI